jgi:hypothetical protein
MLRPELQDMDLFVDGMDNIIATQQRVAEHYFADGSIDDACPPLRALLRIMRDGQFDSKGLEHPDVRALFTCDHLLGSDWYAARLKARQAVDIRLWQRHVRYLEQFLTKSNYAAEAERLGLQERLVMSRQTLAQMKQRAHVRQLHGTLGTDPSVLQSEAQNPDKRKAGRVSRVRLPAKVAMRRDPAFRTAP